MTLAQIRLFCEAPPSSFPISLPSSSHSLLPLRDWNDQQQDIPFSPVPTSFVFTTELLALKDGRPRRHHVVGELNEQFWCNVSSCIKNKTVVIRTT